MLYKSRGLLETPRRVVVSALLKDEHPDYLCQIKNCICHLYLDWG